MNQKALDWIVGDDTGLSSKTIWSVMTGTIPKYPDRPYDGADFGRCYRMLELVPEWKDRLVEVAVFYPEWMPIVLEWKRLEAAYLADVQNEREGKVGGSCYKILNELNDEIMTCGGWVKTGPGSWTRKPAVNSGGATRKEVI